MSTDEVMDAIAHIEERRQRTAKEANIAAASNEALRKLHELLHRETEAVQAHGPAAGRAANIEALTAGIERVKTLGGAAGEITRPTRVHAQAQKPVRSDRPRNRPRNRGRRTMGRGSGR
jgi:hypothetical protein